MLGCDDGRVLSSGENGSPIKPDADTLPHLCGDANELRLCVKVENASEYNDVVEVKLMVFEKYDTTKSPGGGSFITTHRIEVARGEWKNGGFTIELPKTLAPNHLRPFIGEVGVNNPTNILVHPTTIISNQNVRIADAYFVGVDKGGNAIAIFSPVNMIDKYNYVETFFTFVDSDATISGYTKREGHAHPACPDCPSWFEQTTNYLIEWKKGWNVWNISTSHTTTGNIAITTKQWSTKSVNELRWSGRVHEN
jgi:hypothetical protein